MKRFRVLLLLETTDPRYFSGGDGDELAVAECTSLEAAHTVQRLLAPARTTVWDLSVQRHWWV